MSRWFTQLRLRLRSLFHRRRVEQELDEELQYHLERQIEERLTAGLTPEEARYAALRAMGAITQSREECRDMRGVNFLEHLNQDLRFAIRQLLKSPGFACTAIFMLAVAICANVAIFGFVDATLIKPLPYKDQSRLVNVFTTTPVHSRGHVSYLDYVDWRNRNRVFSSIDAYDVRNGFTWSTAAGAERVTGIKVTAGFFRTLGVTPVLGRDFRSGEDSPSAPETVLLSYSAWQKRFGGREDVVGQAVTLDGIPNVIIGVLPRDFHYAPAGPAEFWRTIRGDNACWQRRDCHSLNTVGRLNDGVGLRAALADMKYIAQQLQRQYPDSNRGKDASIVHLRDAIVGDVRPILLILLSGAGLLLLIACINVASLLLVRSDNRKREIAVRNALGASSTRLVRQFATEAVVLVATGCLLGLAFAEWGMRFLISLVTTDMLENMPYLHGLRLNFRLVAFACAVSLIAALLFSLIPVLRVSMSEMLEGLKEGGRGSAGKTWRRLGANLVVVELAIAVILLVSAGLLGKSLYRLLQVDTGLNATHLATLHVGPSPGYSKDEQLVALARQIVDRIANLPGVQSVGVSDLLPLSPGGGTWPPVTVAFRVMGRPYRGEHNEANVRRVSFGYFSTLQARLFRGRYFTEAEDASKPPVVIINETMAEQYFPGEDAIGKQISYGAPSTPQPPMQIVGIVADLKEGPLDAPARPAMYVPFDQNPNTSFSLVVRTSPAEQSLFPSLAAAIHEVQPGLAISNEMSMTERINRLPSAYLHRSSAWLVGSFATFAFLLSVVGLYGVVAYSVGQRTREIGVRMALGAQSISIYQLILREAAWLVGVGTAVGIVCAVAAATLMRRLLFGVHSWDVATLATVAAVLVVSALLASYIPARRAASVNPIEVLRAE